MSTTRTTQLMAVPECVSNPQALVGDGPLWSVREQALYWVDILNRRLHRYSAGAGQKSWDFEGGISAVAEREHHPGLILTTRHGFALFDPATEEFTQLAEPEATMPGNRFNDGKCDSAGRFWAGSMDFDAEKVSGSLYRLTADFNWSLMDTEYMITNGPTWSLDDSIMYHNDSANGYVYAFDFDLAHGELSNKRIFLRLSKQDGSPDGMTTDAEGGLWIAQWGAGKVTRRDATGRLLRTIELPCSHVSSCTFGGPYLRTLYITTATAGLSPAQLEREPLAGGLFAIELDIAGVPANRFGG